MPQEHCLKIVDCNINEIVQLVRVAIWGHFPEKLQNHFHEETALVNEHLYLHISDFVPFNVDVGYHAHVEKRGQNFEDGDYDVKHEI